MFKDANEYEIAYKSICEKLAVKDKEIAEIKAELEESIENFNILNKVTSQNIGFWREENEALKAEIERLNLKQAAQEEAFLKIRKELTGDIDSNTHLVGSIREIKKENEALKKEIEAFQNAEAACCPEDVGFEEYIKALRAELAHYKNGTQIKEVHFDEPVELINENERLRLENRELKDEINDMIAGRL